MITQLPRLMINILALVIASFAFQVKCEELDDTVRISVWVKTAEITNKDLVKYIQDKIIPEAKKHNYNRYGDFITIYESSVSKSGTIFVIKIYPSCYMVTNEICDHPDIYQVDIDNIYLLVELNS